MDYDELAAGYAAHRRHDEAVLAALLRGGAVGRSSCVLEVGCGTGNYAVALSEATGASCVGVEPSDAMRGVAESRSSGVRFLAGAAEALPLPDAWADLVFSVDVVHHLSDLAAAFAETARVLRTGGWACVVTEDEEAIAGRLHSRYFPESVAVELARYPTVAELREAAAAAGLEVTREERTASAYQVTDASPYRACAFSSLALIAPDAHAAGLDRLERALTTGPIDAVDRHLLLWARHPSPRWS